MKLKHIFESVQKPYIHYILLFTSRDLSRGPRTWMSGSIIITRANSKEEAKQMALDMLIKNKHIEPQITRVSEVVDYNKVNTIEDMMDVVSVDGFRIMKISNPPNEVVSAALTQKKLVKNEKKFNDVVKRFFSDNTLLMNKWTRYGEKIRNNT